MGSAGLYTRTGSFLAYQNDCLNGLSCDAAMFTDDVRTWRTIESPSHVQSLHNVMDYLSNWSQGALMKFNTDKYVVLRLQLDRRRAIMFSINLKESLSEV